MPGGCHHCSACWDRGHWNQKLIMLPQQCLKAMLETHSAVSGIIALFHLLSLFPFTFDLTFLTFVIWLRSSTYTCRQRRAKESVGLLVRNCRRVHGYSTHKVHIIRRTSARHQMWHQRPLVTWIALASWCFSRFDMARHNFSRMTHPPAAPPEKSASLLPSCPRQCKCLSGCLDNQMKTDDAPDVLRTPPLSTTTHPLPES